MEQSPGLQRQQSARTRNPGEPFTVHRQFSIRLVQESTVMKAPFYCLAAGLILVFLIASACSLLTPTPPSPADQDALFTQAAQTIVAQLTLTAVNLQPTPSVFLPTETGVPPTDLPAASNTPTSTQAPPTLTPIPPSPTPVPP